MVSEKVRLIALGGFAGSGKSTLTARLGRKLSLPAIDLDIISHALRTSKDFSGRPGASFDVAYALVEDLLRNGTSLIFEQNLGREQTWKRLRSICESFGNVDFCCVILDCPYEVCAARVAKRGRRVGRVDLSVEDLDTHKFKWEYISTAEIPDAIRIDGTQSADAVFEEVVRRLEGFADAAKPAA